MRKTVGDNEDRETASFSPSGELVTFRLTRGKTESLERAVDPEQKQARVKRRQRRRGKDGRTLDRRENRRGGKTRDRRKYNCSASRSRAKLFDMLASFPPSFAEP